MTVNKYFNRLFAITGTIIGWLLIATVVFALVPAISLIFTFVVCAVVTAVIYTLVSMFLAEGKKEEGP